MCHAAAASEERAREQMQALQRKLLRAVTENEALRHVVDKLQCNVLALRRQMQAEGIMPEAELDDSLLAPSPHQVGGRQLPHVQCLVALLHFAHVPMLLLMLVQLLVNFSSCALAALPDMQVLDV